MSDPTLSMDLRRVLDAPRGRRFSHTPHRPGTRPGTRPTPRPTPHPSTSARPDPLPPLVSLGRTPREREILAQMPDTPGLRRRFLQGDLPAWMGMPRPANSHQHQQQGGGGDQGQDPKPFPPPRPTWEPVHDSEEGPGPTPTPKPSRSPDQDTEPAHPLPIPRPRREQVPRPPLPRRPNRHRRSAAHRKPRRKLGPLLTGYALAALAGAAAQPLLALLT